jgi:hypothetical protein
MTANQIAFWQLQRQKGYDRGWLSETQRHNMQTESVAQGELAERQRHQRVEESLGFGNLHVAERNATVNEKNAVTNARNAASNEWNAATNARNAATNARNAEINATNAATNRIVGNSQAELNRARAKGQSYENVSLGWTADNASWLMPYNTIYGAIGNMGSLMGGVGSMARGAAAYKSAGVPDTKTYNNTYNTTNNSSTTFSFAE